MLTPNLNTSEWYVETKLHPPFVRHDIIQRPQLEEELSRSVNSFPLTLLSAPAGYGKTTLLSTIPTILPNYPLAWITLEEEDNDPVRFLGLMVISLQRLNKNCGKSVWPLISGGTASSSDMKRAMGILINDILHFIPDHFILVLDDMHFIIEPAVYIALDYLLEHSPPNLHIAIGTRNDPPLRLNRLLARGKLGEIRRNGLSLKQEESFKLLNNTLELRLSVEEVNELQKRTEGWPGILCLLAGPLARLETREDRTQFLSALAHSEQQAFDFLSEEILLNLPEETQKFLMQTSILSEMTPSICRMVTGKNNADEILLELFKKNLAIASLKTDSKGEPVYRYHSLFSRLLNVQLRRQLPEEIAELHRKAAEVQTTPGRAISHYFSAHLWDQAANLLIKSGLELLHKGMAETVRQWYSRFPVETRNKYSHLEVLMARSEIHRGKYSNAELLLKKARKNFVAVSDKDGEGEALTSLITISYQNNDKASTAKYLSRALELPLRPMGKIAVKLSKAWLDMNECKWDSAFHNINEGLSVPKVTGDRRADIIGITYMSAPMAAIPGCLELTEIYCKEICNLAFPDTAWLLGAQELGTWPIIWRGQIKEGLVRAEKAEELRQRLGGYPFVGNDIPVQLTILYLIKGDLKKAEDSVDLLIQRMENARPGKCMFHIHAAGCALALLSQYSKASEMLEKLVALEDDSPLTFYFIDHLKGLISLLTGDLSEANSLLENAVKKESQLPIVKVGGSARLLQARLFLNQGQLNKAMSIVDSTLYEWKQTNTLGFALLDGPAILPVLEMASEQKNENATHLLKEIQEGLPGNDDLKVSNHDFHNQILEPLTSRECEVLKLLIKGYTNNEISSVLYISKETVKTHVSHIIRKLDVRSRTQAVIRARELGFKP